MISNRISKGADGLHSVLGFEILRRKAPQDDTEDSQGNKYYILQVETGIEYSEAIDVIPCRYTYVVTDKKVEEEPQETEEIEE